MMTLGEAKNSDYSIDLANNYQTLHPQYERNDGKYDDINDSPSTEKHDESWDDEIR